MNEIEAKSIVFNELESVLTDMDAGSFVILDEETIEKAWGWVFFYQSREYVETKDPIEMLAGNAPIIVNRLTGAVTHTGTAYDIEYYIKEYEYSLS